MNVCLVHGYLLTGTGSNIYVQNIARQLCLQGHNVHLVCQESNPGSLDFVTQVIAAEMWCKKRGMEYIVATID